MLRHAVEPGKPGSVYVPCPVCRHGLRLPRDSSRVVCDGCGTPISREGGSLLSAADG